MKRLWNSLTARAFRQNAGERKENGGQALVEYVIIAGIMVLSVTIISLFMYTFKEQSSRILDLVSSEFP
jgi:hypothetical protein